VEPRKEEEEEEEEDPFVFGQCSEGCCSVCSPMAL
jgi:hypothetical protein